MGESWEHQYATGKFYFWEAAAMSAGTGHPCLMITLLLIMVPLTLALLPVLPFIFLLAMRTPPSPRGPYEVGVTEVQQPLLPAAGSTLDSDEKMLR